MKELPSFRMIAGRTARRYEVVADVRLDVNYGARNGFWLEQIIQGERITSVSATASCEGERLRF